MTDDLDLSHLREAPVARATVYRGRLLTLHEDTVRLPNGTEARRELVEHPGAVAVVATTDVGEVVLVRQWRHAVGGALWEIPAGTLDPGEPPATAAARELREETGYIAAHWTAVGRGPCSPGASDEVVHIFAAAGLTAGLTDPDPDETLDVRAFGRGEVQTLFREGGTDLKTIAGLAAAGWFDSAAPGSGE